MKENQPRTIQGNLSRRQVIKYAAMGGLMGPGLSSLSFAGMPASSASNRIIEENSKPGTTNWQLTFIRSRNYRSENIEGYCSRTSVRHGEPLDIFINTSSDTSVNIDIYRMGYYGGKGGRFITQLGPFGVSPQPDPVIAEHRLRECRWERTTQLTIPDDWLSGVYLGKLSCEDHRYESYVIFVVRDDREADLLFQCSDTTWQAYNKWPDSYSLYDSDEPRQSHSARTRASYNRPYGKYPQVVDQPLSQGSGEFLLWEYPLNYWLEKHGYDVTYCSNIDTHDDAEGLKRVRCFLSVGHDEFWTLDMYNNIKEAIADGLNIGFLSGNSIKWVIALEPESFKNPSSVDSRTGLSLSGHRVPFRADPNGNPDRTLYRIGRFGGLTEAEKVRPGYSASFTLDAPDEGLLMGSRNPSPPNGSADWIVRKADHWIFEGTELKNGDGIPGLVGWEFHGDPTDKIPSLEIIASGITTTGGGDDSNYAATVYQGPNGNWIFNAATIFWSIGLSNPPGFIIPHSHNGRPHGADERVQRITANYLKKVGILPAQSLADI